MELDEIIKNKNEEAQNLADRLQGLKDDLETTKGGFPPLWSGSIRELSKFTSDLEEWVKSPKVKEARDLIEELKKQAKDNRSFKGLSDDYLVNSLSNLENSVALLMKIDNDLLKAQVAKKILDKLQDEADTGSLVLSIENYWNSFREFIDIEAEDEFLKAVKEDLLVSLAKTDDFSVDRVVEAKAMLQKASMAVQLLAVSGISIQAYIEVYKNSKSVDKVWECADEIRKLLSDTDFQITEDISQPFGEIAAILDRRRESIEKESLNKICEGLKEVKIEVEGWKKRVKTKFEAEYRKTQALAGVAKLENKLEGLFERFMENAEQSFSVDGIYQVYQELQEIKHKAMAALEGKVSGNERKIIENMDEVDELVEEMGSDFWRALKSLRRQRLIKIMIKRSE